MIGILNMSYFEKGVPVKSIICTNVTAEPLLINQ